MKVVLDYDHSLFQYFDSSGHLVYESDTYDALHLFLVLDLNGAADDD